MTSADDVDALLDRPVLVFGSLPPHGRDLDLLARGPERARLAQALPSRGFADVAGTWLRLTGGSPEVVDLVDVSSWRLPEAEVEALFAQAVALPGHAHLVRPSPAHALLVLARRLVRGGGLDDRRRERVEQALAEDPRAWQTARARARAWGLQAGLDLLREAAEGREPSPQALAAAADELARARGERPSLARLRARARRRGGRRGRVVAISGLDGAGKSSQAAALVAVLERSGHPAVAQWTRMAGDEVLDRIAAPVKRLVARLPGASRPLEVAPGDLDPSRLATPEKRLRQRSRVMTEAWATVVAGTNALNQRRSTARHLREGRTVVCDRWTLDSAVHLRYRYGERRRFRAQAALIRLLSPRPAASFFLDIPAETAYARKDDHYDVAQLRRQQRLYAEEHRRHGAVRLDGERPPAELTAAIAAHALPAVRAGRLARLRRRAS